MEVLFHLGVLIFMISSLTNIIFLQIEVNNLNKKVKKLEGSND